MRGICKHGIIRSRTFGHQCSPCTRARRLTAAKKVAPKMLDLLRKLLEPDRPIDEYHRDMIRKVVAEAEVT